MVSRTTHWACKRKVRCSHPKCKKRAKDFNPPLCRIHSPSRLGYTQSKSKAKGKEAKA